MDGLYNYHSEIGISQKWHGLNRTAAVVATIAAMDITSDQPKRTRRAEIKKASSIENPKLLRHALKNAKAQPVIATQALTCRTAHCSSHGEPQIWQSAPTCLLRPVHQPFVTR